MRAESCVFECAFKCVRSLNRVFFGGVVFWIAVLAVEVFRDQSFGASDSGLCQRLLRSGW